MADYLASAPLSLARTGSAIAVFAHAAHEPSAAAIYSVLRCYDGRQDFNPPAWLALQVMTVAQGRADALARAEAIFNRLRSADAQPIVKVTVGAFELLGVRGLRVPTVIGVRDNGRVDVSFNFEATYRAA